MSLIAVSRLWSANPTTVGTYPLEVYYDFVLDGSQGTGSAILLSFQDSNIPSFGSNFSLSSVVDQSTPGASVTFSGTTDNSTLNTLGVSFTSCIFDCPSSEDMAIARFTFLWQAAVVGADQGSWLIGTDYNGTFEDGGFSTDGGSEPITIDPALCVAASTRVNLASGQSKRIEDLRAGDLLIGEQGEVVPLVKLIRMRAPATRFQRLEANQIKPGCPSNDLLICQGHPIKIGDKVLLPERVSHEVMLDQPVSIFTLMTAKRTFVEMEGLLVATWSEDAWKNFLENDPHAASLNQD
jgi:hypothetical protein